MTKKIKIKFNENERKIFCMLYIYAKKELTRQSLQFQKEYSKYISYAFQDNDLSMQENQSEELEKIKEKIRHIHYTNKFLEQVFNGEIIEETKLFEEIYEKLNLK